MCCLPKEIFADKEYVNSLVCAIGSGVFNHPVALPCQHVFCKSCIETWHDKKNDCPKCRERFSKESLKPQWAFERIIDNSMVKCANTGCKWTGQYKSLYTHTLCQCGEVAVKCAL